ncbi:MAG: NAD(P)/FAD-dependent oxidoreductase [Pseudomonadota bacterium]
MTTDIDVAVIGAGAAGLAAGAALRNAGLSYRVLEAKDRIGGRAYTDTTTFGVPFDHGCHWLHSASVNPLRMAADRLGIAYGKDIDQPPGVFLNSTWQPDDAVDRIDLHLKKGFDVIDRAGRLGQDVSAASVIDQTDDWWPFLRHWIEILCSGQPEDMSVKDMVRYHDTEENWPVVKGFGALVARVGADVVVDLQTEVRSIEKTASGVRIGTANGTLTAGAVIVTVSTAVLASGAIRFTPDLPDPVREAIRNVPLGMAEKIALGFDRDVFGFKGTKYAAHMHNVHDGGLPLTFTLSPFGYPLAISFIGGHEVPYLRQQGEQAMIELALDALGQMYGNTIRARFTRGYVTDWAGDPHIRGGYSYAKAGQAHARDILVAPFDERIFLAGEATSSQFFSTAHGAHLSGLRAAGRAIAALHRPADLALVI